MLHCNNRLVRRRLPSLAAVLFALAASGCHGQPAAGTCEADTRDEPYAANLAKKTKNGTFTVTLVSSTPAPPIKGDNNFALQISDAAGAPVAGATITVTPFMPDHGHGTPKPAIVTAGAAPGTYTATPVNLFMTGLWEITVSVKTGAPAAEDAAVFKFCIDG